MPRSCPTCGYGFNADHATRCSVCGEVLTSNGDGQDDTSHTRIAHQNDCIHDQPSRADQKTQPRFTGTDYPPAEPPDNGGTITGRLIHVERYEERPPTDIYRVLSKILIGILILVPFVILFFITGILSFAFAVLGFQSLSQMFNPVIWSTSIFELIEVMVLSRIRGTDTVPIYRGAVADEEDNRHAFWFRGPLLSGNLITGHDVRLEGRIIEGTFLIESGQDMTTNSLIRSSYRSPWRIIFFILIVIYGIGGLLSFNYLY